ncbi:MAG: 2-oxoglutarate dehydrogenase complex dihydrolipoyllysine-residue succinyltransferase [Amylibacter sp.]
MTEVRVPTLGESVTEAILATWFKKAGDPVIQDEMICELETDKVTVEVAAPVSGILSEIVADEGVTVGVDALLAQISEGSISNIKTEEISAKTPDDTPSDPEKNSVKNAPSAEKLMEENNIKNVSGTGRDGRIMKGDVLDAIASPILSQKIGSPVKPRQNDPREERVTMTRLRQTIARRLKESQNTAAMLTTYNEVDMTSVMDLRAEYKDMFMKKHGVKLGFMSFFTKACCHALKEIPEVNSEIDGNDVVYKNYVNMGIAAGTPTGLVVPVINDVDQMSFADIEKAIAEKGARARSGKLSMAEMQGGTFTISNGGVYGSLMSSPILNPPQSGILGMHTIQKRPVVINDNIAIRPMMYLALSYDHRVVDGKGAVTFLVRVKEALEDPRRLLMDL